MGADTHTGQRMKAMQVAMTRARARELKRLTKGSERKWNMSQKSHHRKYCIKEQWEDS
jgi:hypothetical protein